MTYSLPTFYKSVVPLDASKHRNAALRENFGLGFARHANAVPINLVEIPQLCHFYPIAFSPNEDATPVALLGIRDNENLFVDDEGNWIEDSYIPAYIRRYPFIFQSDPDEEQFTLCIDEDLLEESGEARIFNDDGTPSPLAQSALEFCKSFHVAAEQTAEFSRALAENGLLINREFVIKTEKKHITFTGFRIIDEQKLAEIKDDEFLTWRKKGWLPFLYACLLSGPQWKRLGKLLDKRLEQEGT